MSTNKKLTKVTLEELIRRKTQAENSRMEYKDIDIPLLGISIPFQKLPVTSVLEMMEELNSGIGIGKNYEKCVELIYNSCPIMRNEKLLEGCAEPYDIVALIFNDNIKAILDTGAKIMNEFYGASEEEEIKN